MSSPAALLDWIQRRRGDRSSDDPDENLDLVGFDFTGTHRSKDTSRNLLVVAFVVILLPALSLVALRTEIIRLRYELADAVRAEQRVAYTKRELTVEVRQLRDPARLNRMAIEMGLSLPQQVIQVNGGLHSGSSRSGGTTP